MNWNDILQYSYVLVWTLVLMRTYKKSHCIGIGFFIIAEFIVCGLFSIQVMHDSSSEWYKETLSFFPMLVFFFFLYITSYPLIRYDRTFIETIQQPNSRLLKTIAIAYIGLSMISLPSQLSDIITNLPLIILEMETSNMYDDAKYSYESIGTGSMNLPVILSGLLFHVGVLLAFYYLYLNDPKKKILVVLLFISFIPALFSGLSSGQRGGIIQTVLFISGTYFMFRRFYKDNIKKRIDRVFTVSAVLFGIVIGTMTISRFGEGSENAGSSVFFYGGHQQLVFNKYAFDNNGIRYGDRTAPLVKLLMGSDRVPNNFMERRAKYPKLYVDDYLFITYVGDFFLDYGPFFASIFLLVMSYFMIRGTTVRNKQILFHQLMLLEILVFTIPIGTIKLFQYSEIRGNVSLLFDLMLCVLFYIDYTHKFRRKANYQ